MAFKNMASCLGLLLLFNGFVSAQMAEAPKALILLFDGVEILDFAGPMETLMQAGMDVYTIAPTKQIKAMNKLSVSADYMLGDENMPRPDVLVVPGGGGIHNCIGDTMALTLIKALVAQAKINFSVCTGAYLLAELGLLDGQKATTHYAAIDWLQADYPKVDLLKDTRFVDNGRVITTAGISAGIDGALHLVSRLEGKSTALYVAKAMEYDKWTPGEGHIIKDPNLELLQQTGVAASPEGAFRFLFKGEIIDLGVYFMEKGQFADAEQCFSFATQNYPCDAWVFDLLAGSLRKQGKFAPPTQAEFFGQIKDKGMETTAETYREVRAKFPDWVLFSDWEMMTLIEHDYLEAEKYQESIEILQFLQSIYPDFWACYFDLGYCYEQLGEMRVALGYYQKSDELNPNHADTKQRIATVERALTTTTKEGR